MIRTPDGLMPVPGQVSYGAGDIVGFLVHVHVAIDDYTFLNQAFISVECRSVAAAKRCVDCPGEHHLHTNQSSIQPPSPSPD